MGERIAWGACLSFLLAGCLTVVDPRCSTDNCQTLAECGLSLGGEPREPDICFTANLEAELQYCVEACDANRNGALVACIASTFGAGCAMTNGRRPTLAQAEAACGPSTDCGPNCMSCSTACEAAASRCNQACTDTPDGGCLACEYQCSQQQVGCSGGCPTN